MQGYKGYKHTLVATLGGQPQIVTFTLDLLLKRGTPINEVIVVHPASSPRVQQSLERLRAEFAWDRYTFEGCSLPIIFRQQVLTRYDNNDIVDDIIDEPTAHGTLDTIGELIRDLKQRQHIIHFSISGGRRLMAFLSFSATLLYFDSPVELLHLYTPEPIQERDDNSGAMHISPQDGRRLIEVPFARAAQPFLALMLNRTPSDTILTQREQQQAENRLHCKQVVDALTDKQCEVLQALAQGLRPDEVALMLGIKSSTISHHTNIIYRECRNAWNLPEKPVVNYLFVQARFADYFSHEESIPHARKKVIQTDL